MADIDRSVAFYSRLGLARTASSLNIGPEQEKLDNLFKAVVEVTALAPPTQAVPHVELLCYRGKFDRRKRSTNRNDVAATQLVFEVEPDALDTIVALNRDTTISSSTTAESGFQLPTILAPIAAPNPISVRRDRPRHITMFPGGGSLARARYPPNLAILIKY